MVNSKSFVENRYEVNIPDVWLNVYRAVQIAAVGDFNLALVYSTEHNKRRAQKDSLEIMNFYKDIYPDFKEAPRKYTLYVEIESDADYLGSYNRKYDIDPVSFLKMIQESREPLNTKLDDSSLNLLKRAVIRLQLSMVEVNAVHKIAKAIATLDCKQSIFVEHVAEAIQYLSVDFATLPNALPSTRLYRLGLVAVGDL